MITKLIKKKEFSVFLIILIISFFLTIINPVFFTFTNFMDILKGNVVVGILALGMLPVLITGGIDLSVSANIALTTLITGKLLTQSNMGLPSIFLICCIAGGIIGILNGLIITCFSISPIVATLGIQSIMQGTILVYTKGNMITNMPEWFQNFGRITVANIPIQIFFLILTTIIMSFILKYTLIGREVYAIGGSEASAVRVGYNPQKIKIFVYTLAGVLSGIAGVLNTSIVQGVNPNTFVGTELNVIAIVVIGGASTLGGTGTVLGTFLGMCLMAILNNGLVLAKIPTFWQKIVMGIIIISAVSVDVISKKYEQSRLVRIDLDELEEK